VRWGYSPNEVLADESSPDHRVCLQAEVTAGGPSHIPNPIMRYALFSGVGIRQAYDQMDHVWGIRALEILRFFLDPPSMDKLEEVMSNYPQAVVELSTYPIGVGILGWNTLFWEVRNY